MSSTEIIQHLDTIDSLPINPETIDAVKNRIRADIDLYHGGSVDDVKIAMAYILNILQKHQRVGQQSQVPIVEWAQKLNSMLLLSAKANQGIRQSARQEHLVPGSWGISDPTSKAQMSKDLNGTSGCQGDDCIGEDQRKEANKRVEKLLKQQKVEKAEKLKKQVWGISDPTKKGLSPQNKNKETVPQSEIDATDGEELEIGFAGMLKEVANTGIPVNKTDVSTGAELNNPPDPLNNPPIHQRIGAGASTSSADPTKPYSSVAIKNIADPPPEAIDYGFNPYSVG